MKSCLLPALLLCFFLAGSATGLEAGSEARFDWVSYAGSDPIEAALPVTANEYRNPIIPGFEPDPSIIRVGGDFYLTTSSFAFYPGLPIYHSRDLVNWEQIGNAIDRPGEFDFSHLGIARAIFAPTIRWHAGMFYLVDTCVDCGSGFLLTARNPSGPWSAPHWIKAFDGIDPDLFFDADGRAWIASNGPPPGTPLYEGHRALWIQELDLTSLQLRGPRRLLVNGGVDPARSPIWVEAPHIIVKDGWYYLIAAEGGTAGEHSETVYRSRQVTGPYRPGLHNPILTQRDLAPDRPFPVYAAGHADFVDAGNGQWWAVFLGTRPYEANLSNLGRETFLLPVSWRDGWPQVLPATTPVPQVLPRPDLPLSAAVDWAGWRDSFSAPVLARDWEMVRTPQEPWYRIDPRGGLILTARTDTVGGTGNPSFLGKRQRHSHAMVEARLRYAPQRSGDQAGLLAFADERHHYFVGLLGTLDGTVLAVAARNGASEPDAGRILVAQPYRGAPDEPIQLRITATGATYDFAYAGADGAWHTLLSGADGRILASEPTNQFTGALIGVYAARIP